MSVDLLGANRELMFVNLSAIGKESLNGHQAFCTAKQTYRDSPLLFRQDMHLVCATRWQVPTSEVPTIEPTSFELWEYNATNDPLPNGTGYVAPLTYADFAAHEAAWDALDQAGQVNPLAGQFRKYKTFYLPAASSAYQWFAQVESELHAPIPYMQDNTADGFVIGTEYKRYSDRIKFVLLPDMRAQIWISDKDSYMPGGALPVAVQRTYTLKWYIKCSRGLFDMLQMQVSTHVGNHNNATVGNTFTNHTDYRLMGREGAGNEMSVVNLPWTILSGLAGTAPVSLTRFFTASTSATSAADMFNCHRKLVLTSDLITKAERTMTNFGSRKRQLVEFDLMHDTTFSYQIYEMRGTDPYAHSNHNIGRQTTVNEILPSARRYASKGGVDGRWMQLSSPSPLYQLEVTAHIIIWSFEKREFEQRKIPLPAGGVFDVKLVFVNKDELLEGKDHHHR
jgi:hypothetical protein